MNDASSIDREGVGSPADTMDSGISQRLSVGEVIFTLEIVFDATERVKERDVRSGE